MLCDTCGSEVAQRAVPREPDPQALRHWVQHLKTCRSWRGIETFHRGTRTYQPYDCNCGLDAALAGRPVPPQEKEVNDDDDALSRVDR